MGASAFVQIPTTALHLLVTLTICSTVYAGTSLDPVKNFCRRIGHSSVYKNNTLFINGGLQTFVDFGPDGQQDSNTITSGINEDVISVDMTGSWNWRTNVSISKQSKTQSGIVEGMKWPVNIHDGALFGGQEDSGLLYMFGGTTQAFNQSFPYYLIPPTEAYSLWIYDIAKGLWVASDTSASGITIPSWGASAETPSGFAFYLGGQIDGGTAATTQYLENTTIGLGGMVVIDTKSTTVSNLTVADSVISNRQGAGMVYVDNFGGQGVLILLGGRTQDGGFLPMSDISVFDMASLDVSNPADSEKNVWYQQKATGNIPSGRTDFCLVAAPAQDNSSTSIYLYGGRGGASLFDDIYVLSIPSFTWIKVFVGQDARWSVTCHFVAPKQMITVGGGGKSSDITKNCDWEQKSLAVLDLSTVEWGSTYNADAAKFDVPAAVLKEIGGGPTGQASKIEPSDGWSEVGLSALFQIKTSDDTHNTVSGTNSTDSGDPFPVPSPLPSYTPLEESFSLSMEAIVGIAIGSVVLLTAVASGIFLCVQRRRLLQHRSTEQEPPMLDSRQPPKSRWPPSELAGTTVSAELGSKPKDGTEKTIQWRAPVEKDAGSSDTSSHTSSSLLDHSGELAPQRWVERQPVEMP